MQTTGEKINWRSSFKRYENFTDLGNYVIRVDNYKHFDIATAIKYVNNQYDGWRAGCTACATLGNNNDVLIGRNLDLTVSTKPCYITQLKFGKYSTINFTYDEFNPETPDYKVLLKRGKLDDEYYNALPMLATDSMNSEGLYIEYNMRAKEDYFNNTGSNPQKMRVSGLSLPVLVTSNCRTINEALHYIKHELNIYTINNDYGCNGWNLGFMIGDATGEYGLIEIARNEVSYIPYQWGQGNYYITPRWNVLTRKGSGYGRFAMATEGLKKIGTEQEMLKHMERCMWRNELLYINYAYRDRGGHIHFVDNKGNKTIDWRSDFEGKVPVDINGKFVKKTGYEKGYEAYLKGATVFKKDYLKHKEYLDRCTEEWVNNDDNFEAVQFYMYNKYKNDGTLRKLLKYYAGDEEPLRKDANIWTTSLSIAVNCTKKHIMVKFWEKSNVVYEYQW